MGGHESVIRGADSADGRVVCVAVLAGVGLPTGIGDAADAVADMLEVIVSRSGTLVCAKG